MASKFARPSFPRRFGMAVAAFVLSSGTLGLIAPAALAATACTGANVAHTLDIVVDDGGDARIEYVTAGGLNVDVDGDVNGVTATGCKYYTEVYEVSVEQANGNDEAYVFIEVSDTDDLPPITIDLGNGDDELTLEGTSGNDDLDATDLDIKDSGGADLGWLLFDGGVGNDTMVETDAVKNANKYHVIFGGGPGTDTADRSDRNDDLDYTMPGDLENYIGGEKEDKVIGNALNNVIQGGPDKDDLRGGGGNDILVGGDDGDDYDGGAGTDLISFDDETYDGAADDDVTFSMLADGKNVENLIGSSYDDDLTGNDVANRIEGLAGDDTIDGGRGNDTLTGTSGDDTLLGGKGDDRLDGGLDDDVLEGGDNEDVLDGGLGFDLVSYEGSDAGVTVNLASPNPTGGDAAGDLIGGFEGAIGSDFNDTLTGTAAANTLDGGKGNDLLVGLGGADKLVGGVGIHDKVTYAASTEGVTISLIAGAGKGGDAEGDTFSRVEDVVGTSAADIIMGNRYGNSIVAGDGNDKVAGGAGADTLDGGEGTDTVSFADAPEGVTVRLGFGDQRGGDGVDRFVSIENVIGSAFADTITGNDGVNIINGGGGDDRIYGLGGNDTLFGGTGNDLLSGGEGNDKLASGGGDDSLIGGAGKDVCASGPGEAAYRECE